VVLASRLGALGQPRDPSRAKSLESARPPPATGRDDARSPPRARRPRSAGRREPASRSPPPQIDARRSPRVPCVAAAGSSHDASTRGAARWFQLNSGALGPHSQPRDRIGPCPQGFGGVVVSQ
jgi:hypothetical protein